MKWLIAVALGVSLAACSSNEKQAKEETKVAETSELKPEGIESAVKELKAFEDSLKKTSASGTLAYSQETAVVYAEKCLDITHRFPKSNDAAKYMDKAHVIFASANLHQRSVIIADSLIMRYPTYKNRPMVLESLAGAYDVLIIPRQKDKVKKYYELLLKDNQEMDPTQRKFIEKRLKYIDLPFNEYVEKAN